MTKDRLLELIKTSTPSLDQKSLKSHGNEASESMETILSPYTQIRFNLRQIKENLEKIRRLMQTVSIRNVSEKEMDEIRDQNLKIGSFLINQFEALKTDLPVENDFCLEARIKRTLFHGLHQNYRGVWYENEELLQMYEKSLKKNLEMHAKLINRDTNEEELEELIKNKTTNLFVGNILEETEKERRTLRDLMDRLGELKRLEKSIEEVHAVFIRIQTLVFEQNEIIQRVEYHAQEATLYTEKGANQLEKADELHKKALKKKFIIIVIIMGLLMILLIMCFL